MKILRYACAAVLTIIFAPMLIFWGMLDFCMGENATKSFLRALWIKK